MSADGKTAPKSSKRPATFPAFSKTGRHSRTYFPSHLGPWNFRAVAFWWMDRAFRADYTVRWILPVRVPPSMMLALPATVHSLFPGLPIGLALRG